jgi:hypothetical protein
MALAAWRGIILAIMVVKYHFCKDIRWNGYVGVIFISFPAHPLLNPGFWFVLLSITNKVDFYAKIWD